MHITINLRDDQPELLRRLKEVRHTKNSNQIFREALYEYAKKNLPDFVHQRTGGIKTQGGQDEN